jgi:hypothetical protein
MSRFFCRTALLAAATFAIFPSSGGAQTIVQSPDAAAISDGGLVTTESDATTTSSIQAATTNSDGGNFFERWQARATATQARQPGWAVPVFAPYPMLIQVFRADFDRQITPTGATTWNLGSGKGLNLIPFANTEFDIYYPPYLTHSAPTTIDGFGDMSFLGKYRFLTSDAAHHNAMLSALVIATIPTGSHKNGSLAAVVTPTLAGGKGFGNFDVQSTIGIALPVNDTNKLGRPIPWNVTAQYRLSKIFWPEIESNATFYDGGPNHGKMQEFITPGAVVSKIRIHPSDPHSRLGLALGAGMQIATSSFHSYNHQLVLTTRFLF